MKDHQSEQEKPKPSQGGLTGRRDWEGAIEEQIREAMERGDFENLPGRGKPLDLRRDPNTPAEWDLAFKLLKDAGFAPDWIEQDKEIRAAKIKVFKPLQNYANARGRHPAGRAASEARLIADFRKSAAEVNRLIDDYNLKAPSPRLHHTRIRIEMEIERFREATRMG